MLLRGVGVGGYGERTFSALTVEHDRGGDGIETVETLDRELVGTGDVHVADGAASITDHVMVVVGVGVESSGATTDRDLPKLSHSGELIQRLVHGAKRDPGHFFACTVVERFC